jgi:hypothetical protein
MSLSKECQEYHLTPRGWVEGTFKGDALGGSNVVEPPDDTRPGTAGPLIGCGCCIAALYRTW